MTVENSGRGELADILDAAASLCACHMAGVQLAVNVSAPASFNGLPEGRHMPAVNAPEILANRAGFLADAEELRLEQVGLPDEVLLIDDDGTLRHAPADRLTPTELAVAQVVAATQVTALMRASSSLAVQIVALERLRLIAADLDALPGVRAPGSEDGS